MVKTLVKEMKDICEGKTNYDGDGESDGETGLETCPRQIRCRRCEISTRIHNKQ